MGLGCFQPVLVLALAVTWHGVSVSGETYVVWCNGSADIKFNLTDEATIDCEGTQITNITDDGADAVEVSIENSIATITVREGTTTTSLLFDIFDEFDPVEVDIRNTDFSKATLLESLSFYFLGFVDPNVTLTVSDFLSYLYIGANDIDDVGLNVSDNSNLTYLALYSTYNRVPRILYERNYTKQLDIQFLKSYLTFNWTGTQALTEEQIATLKHNIPNLGHLGLAVVDDCSTNSSNAYTYLLCASDSPPKRLDNKSSTRMVLIVVIVAAVMVVSGMFFLFIRHRHARKSGGAENTQTLITSVETSSNRHDKPIGQVQDVPDQPAHPRPWDDDVVIKARIPSDKVDLYDIMSRGAFGEVYRGSYRGQPVAVKMLNPSMRHETKHIELFFHEIKIMATLEHPNIVQFVGVAWDSLTEVCAVSELMDGGDLRTLLMEYHENRKPQGFDSAKIKIAADVAHALTYLHSFQPVVLHRDLKSRNILLSADRKTAKVTDFGTSRERADITMTIGVGTSLWMAPEVIMGGRYDDRADIFSFGVVLSELATHELPYAHATKTASDEPMSVAAIMQAVVSGHLHLDFATSAPHSSAEIVALARACTSLDPSTRPAAATVAWKLIQILRSMTD